MDKVWWGVKVRGGEGGIREGGGFILGGLFIHAVYERRFGSFETE
jgi:hypothetical protein